MTANRSLPFILLAVVLSSILFIFYFYFIKPIKAETEFKATSVLTERNKVKELEARLEAAQWEKEGISEKELIAKIPEKRELLDMIRLLQEAELKTATTIESIVFNDYDGSVQESTIDVVVPEADPGAEVAEPGTETPESAETPKEGESDSPEGDASSNPELVSDISKESLPGDLMLLTLEATVSHRDYTQFMQFLETIEDSERIIKIDLVEFGLPGEKTGTDLVETITSKLQLTTFYMKKS